MGVGPLFADLRYACRMLARNPGYTAVAVLTLALGIGANTATFTLVHSVLLRPLPYKDADRLVHIWQQNLPRGWTRVGVSGPNYMDWREQSRLFEELSLHEQGSATLTGMGEPEQVPGMRVTTNFFAVTGARAELGRLFLPEEERGGRHNVGIVTHGFWRRRFASDPGIIGRQVQMDGLTYTCVGVLSADFWLPVAAEVFVPWDLDELRRRNRAGADFGVVGRLKPGVTLAQASEEINAIQRRIGEQNAGFRDWSALVLPLRDALVGGIRRALVVLLGAVGFVLLIACANVANLLLARGIARQKEIAIRAAIGAGRGRLVRQLLTESLLLGLMGGAFGLLTAAWGADFVARLLPRRVPIEESATLVALARVSVDGTVLAFTFLTALATGFVFGLAPALAASQTSPGSALKTGGGPAGAAPHRLRDGLVISEIALALVLLAGAGLMIQTFRQLLRAQPGFVPGHLLTVEMELPTDSKYRQPREQAAVFERFLEGVQALPGVRSAALTHIVPLSEYENRTSFEIQGPATLAPGERATADFRSVSPDYFHTLGIPLVAGRSFDHRDHAAAPCVVIVDQLLARRYWPAEDPLGRRLGFRRGACEIVGVVGAVKGSGMRRDPQPTLYMTYWQVPVARMSLVVRTLGDQASLAETVKRAVWAVDSDQPVYNIRTMDQLVAESTSDSRFTLILLSVFAALALALAMVGIYGVMSYSVSQRRQEIGIRMALGARSGDVFRMVVGCAMRLAAIGVATGLAGALAVTRALAALLYGVSPTDPATLAAMSTLIALVALGASCLPARRAARTDPLAALRYE